MSPYDAELERLGASLNKPPYKLEIGAECYYKVAGMNCIVTDRGIMEDERGPYIAYWIEGSDNGQRFDGLVKEFWLQPGRKIE